MDIIANQNSKLVRLVHVEDDPDILEITRMALECSEKFEIQSYSSGKDALIAMRGDAPDVFLLDMMMPDISGKDLLAELRNIPTCKNIPVIFMTARAQRHEVDEMLLTGACRVILKPFDPMNLADEIIRVIDMQATHRDLDTAI
jgi:DNA-binding response OmpR family regulator